MSMRRPTRRRRIPGWAWFAAALLALNVFLLSTHLSSSFVFLPEKLAAGEWWRFITHPFVHVSLYHLLLDGAAFLLLYTSLSAGGRFSRPGYVLAAAAGSLGASLLADPMIRTIGLCGLSGIAHGLMAASALQCLDAKGPEGRPLRIIGTIMFPAVVLKAGYEVLTGGVLFAGLHFGYVGQPLAACHAGGIVGALLIHSIVLLSRTVHATLSEGGFSTHEQEERSLAAA